MRTPPLLLACIVATATVHGQGLINIQPGTGVPTDMAIGGLLGAIIAPMISKGADAKLVGGLLGAMAGGAYGTAQQQPALAQLQQQQLQQQQMWQQQQHMLLMQQMQTSAGGRADAAQRTRPGIRQGEYVQSPYSRYRFHMQSQNIQSGDTLYDPQTGQPFLVP